MKFRICYNVIKHRILRFNREELYKNDNILNKSILLYFNDDEDVMSFILNHVCISVKDLSKRLKDNDEFLKIIYEPDILPNGCCQLYYVSERLKKMKNL